MLLSVPRERLVPLRWVAGIVFDRMLGLPVEVTAGDDASSVRLSQDGRMLVMPSLFPGMKGGAVDTAMPLPAQPLPDWSPSEPGLADALEGSLPVLFGTPEISGDEGGLHCAIDVLGTIFFMLSRIEEMAILERDSHDRFPAVASLAHKAGFLNRPIVDEYVEGLWMLMHRIWPSLTRNRRPGTIAVSCDVDRPFDHDLKTPLLFTRSLAADILVRRDLGRARQRFRHLLAAPRGDYRFDPLHTFDWYLDTCEKAGRQAAFYFIPAHSAGLVDGTYSLDEERVVSLISKIGRRGHRLGVHGSYNTFRNPAQIATERTRMIAACRAAAVDDSVTGNRQHFLRWSSAETPDHLEAAGFAYDTTGSFADRPGFRYGTAHSFPMWSWQTMAPLKLLQKPLVVMEASVLSSSYLGMGYTSEAFDLMFLLRRRALRYGGDFALLWHNSHLTTDKDREFFAALVN